MTAFGMQVACDCDDQPTGMECTGVWDGNVTPGFDQGRRYVWECPNCARSICINMNIQGESE